MAEDLKHPFNHGLLEELIVFGLMLPDLGDGLTLNLASIVKVESQANGNDNSVLVTSLGGIYTELTQKQSAVLEEKVKQLLTLAAGSAPKQSPNSRIVLPHRRTN